VLTGLKTIERFARPASLFFFEASEREATELFQGFQNTQGFEGCRALGIEGL
jgi:hypothetical protein